jgi:hypothetical protein
LYLCRLQDLPGAAKADFSETRDARTHMPLPSFQQFARDFDLTPGLTSKTQVAEAFRCARFGPSSSAEAGTPASQDALSDLGDERAEGDLTRLSFGQFVDAVARLALIAYNFQDQRGKAEAAMGFQESYQGPAKSLWMAHDERLLRNALSVGESMVSASLRTSLGLPFLSFLILLQLPLHPGLPVTQVSMPSAFFDQIIFNQEAPVMDEASMAKSTVSRAASKIFSNSKSTVASRHKVFHAGEDLDVMRVHDEPPVLPMEGRPLHITQFSAEWVGRPATPPMENARYE